MIDRLRQSPDLWRFIKFLAVGLLNTVFGYAVYVVCVLAGFGPQTALAIAFGIGVLWNYLTHARIVFKTGGYRRLPAYVVVYAVLYLCNRWALALLLGAGVGDILAQGLLLVPMAGLAFFGISAVLTGVVPVLGIRLPKPLGPGN